MTELDMPVDLMRSIAKLDTLPAIPVIAQKLLMLQLDTDEGEAQFLKLIEHDPQISAKIVGLANAPLYGASRKVLSVADAVMMLGMSRVRSVVFGIVLMSSLSQVPEGKLKTKEVWMHSMAVAVAMSTIARAIPASRRPLDDHIFLAGLLHDIGYMALSYLDVSASDQLHEQLQQTSGSVLLKVEQALLGTTHAEIGGELARHWGLPNEVIVVIRDHHNPNASNIAEHQTLVKLVTIAEKMLGEFGVLKHTEQIITDQEWEALGIDPEKADDIRSQVCEIATQAGQMVAAF
jgi:putative nucleotidyltransferase with HDIG domain